MAKKVPIGPRAEAEPQMTPRRADGRCGRCGGLIVHDVDLGDKCSMCGRVAGPRIETAEEIRKRVKSELTALASGLDPAQFWQSYFLSSELARIVGLSSGQLTAWMRSNSFSTTRKRNPNTGKKSHFLTIADAKRVIEALS